MHKQKVNFSPQLNKRLDNAALAAGVDEAMNALQEFLEKWSAVTKEEDSEWIKSFRNRLDGKDKTKQQPVEKAPPLAPHYPGVGVPPVYQPPSTEKQKDKSRLDITDRFYLLNQNYGKRTRRL